MSVESRRFGDSEKIEAAGQVESLRERIALLSGVDKLIMKMRIDHGNTFVQIAELSGLSESTVTRRFTRNMRRLNDIRYVLLQRHRYSLSFKQREIARDFLLRGLAVREIARRRRCSVHQVRKTLDELSDLAGKADDFEDIRRLEISDKEARACLQFRSRRDLVGKDESRRRLPRLCECSV